MKTKSGIASTGTPTNSAAELRKTLRPATPDELRTAMRLLYRAIGINAKFDMEGNVTISACYFSSFYSGRICRLISALDAGVAAGLSGGGRLVFSQRMTEGHDCCLARLELEIAGIDSEAIKSNRGEKLILATDWHGFSQIS